MDAKFYIKNLTNSSKQNSGEGNQNQEGNQTETDPIKIYLNQLATKEIEKGTSYKDIFSPQNGSSIMLLHKDLYTNLLQQLQINSENKIGDENNYEFVILEFPDDVDISSQDPTIFENSKFIFVDNENTNYFLNKFIKISAKQFMKSVLYGMDYQNTNTLFDGLDINAKNFEENIAINNFKFVIQLNQENVQYIVIDDIDLETFYFLGNNVVCVFDENESKMIFKPIKYSYGPYRYIEFKFSNDSNYIINTQNINETNYKILERKTY